jgi:hypothetical protein
MKTTTSNLTQQRLKEQLAYDPETGLFSWRVKPKKPFVTDVVGCIANGYLQICIDGCRYSGHRVAWVYVYGAFPPGHLDHINGIRSDNRISNLRIADFSVNAQNRHNAYKNSVSGVLGAKWHKGQQKYLSAIRVNGKSLHLGTFEHVSDAHAAYIAAKSIYHPGYSPAAHRTARKTRRAP